MMKRSLNGANSVFGSFADWLGGMASISLVDDDGLQLAACGHCEAPRRVDGNDSREVMVRPNRWAPGLSLDNFS